jgi:hypothetical protein
MYFCRTKTPYGRFLTAKNSLAFKLPLANLKGVSEIRNSFPLMTASRNSKGRPLLTEGKRTKKIDARFTEEEFKVVLELEKQLGIRRTDLVRMRLLNNAASLVINAKDLIASIDSIGAEMGRAGNNINQLAHYANILKNKGLLREQVAERFNMLFESYIGHQKELETALRKIIRLMGR